jgi:hypothetical protein
MKLSASQAAQKVGKSVPTITRAIKSGRLSGSKLDSGGYEIDASELFRVFPAISNDTDATPTKLGNETAIETNALQREIELLRERVEDLKEDRDSWKDQAQKVAGLIENHSPAAPTSGWFDRLLGRK